MNKKKLRPFFINLACPLSFSSLLLSSCINQNQVNQNPDIDVKLINSNINKADITLSDFVFIYDKSKYALEKPILSVLEDKVIVLAKLLFKDTNLHALSKTFSFVLPKPNTAENHNDSDVEHKKHDETNKNNDSNADKIVIIPDIPDLPTKPINQPETVNLSSKHSFAVNYLLSKNPYEIATKTNEYINAFTNISKWLNTADNGNPVNFRYGDVNSNKHLLDKYWEYTKDIGIYGNYGTSPEQKVDFYNNTLSSDGMYSQKFLDNFNESDKEKAIKLDANLNDLVLKNPFGFLPSNLSQLFYYMDYKSATEVLKINEKITDLKANFDDNKGSIELLITTALNKYIINLNKDNTNNLKADLDFYQYIYDHSFSLRIGTVEFRRDPYRSTPDHLATSQTVGTVWVMDRIISPEAEKDDSYELLLATNVHVFNLRSAFDRSLYFESDQSHNVNKWYGGFWDIDNFYDSETDIYRKRQNIYFMGTRAKDDKLSSNTAEISGDQFKETNLLFKAYEQYLTTPYYTPRYYTNGIMGYDIAIAPQYFDKYDEESRIGESKNAGADFVLLRLKIKKANLSKILPELAKVIGTEKEKDWHIGVGKNGKHHPIKTTLYGGYPAIDNTNFQFKAAKSQGGVINVQNRVISDSSINSLWVKYNEEQNKDFNSINNNWLKYTKSFINKPNTNFEDEHGMPLTTINQHSHMYTKVLNSNNNENALESGSSGSLAIDSSFNLVGINYLHTHDELYNTYSNAISLMEGHSTYSNNFDGNLRNDIKNKLIKDNVHTVKINPKQ